MARDAIDLISEERNRQVQEEGYTAEHDDDHTNGAIAVAAACYAAPYQIYGHNDLRGIHTFYDPFPWGHTIPGRAAYDRDSFRQHTTGEQKKDKDRIRQLVIAGALIVAEIDRLQRLEDAAKGD